ncbi:MAG: S9 family peptidase [Bacteroidales bacterium]|jgi:dipeptidyl aminopeptidase/acylaminoacyl peptidase|nr:S9 family peptidase [Bacteroidales bacterium]
MKTRIILIGLLLAGAVIGFLSTRDKKQTETIIGKPEVTVVNGQMTPEILWSFGRVGEYAVSPDTSRIAYTVTYFDIDENKGNAEIYLMDADGGNVRQLTHTATGERNLVWSNDGKKLYCLYQGQIHEVNLKNGKLTKISDFPKSIEAFSFSPDQTKILYVSTIPRPKPEPQLFANLPKTSGRIIDDLHYRHWDQFVDNDPQLFVTDFAHKIENGKNLLEHTPYLAPMRPFGGLEQTDWSPCGTKIAYTSKKKTGKEWVFSTNSDIYVYDLIAETVYNISEDMMGYDKNPTFSPDGSMIAWESMEHDGYESDQKRLFTYNFDTKEKIYHTQNYDFDVQNLLWSKDGKTIYFIKPWHGRQNVFSIDLTTNIVTQISNENADFNSLNWLGEKLIVSSTTMSRPTELFSVDLNGQTTQLSQVNTDLLSQLKFGKVEERWIKTTDNKDMLVWVVYPINFDPNKKYPALLFCGGGPQSMIGQFWSYRWNPQLMAANDYVVVLPNRRGVPGFGKAWNEQISGDYGGQNKQDLLRAIDVIAKEPFVDETRLGATGASYGGFSIYWLAGNHNNRFAAFLAHNGIFNFEQMYTETEEMFFLNWDYGGAFWDKNNKIAQRTYANSPHLFVTKWNTPICVVHCELDYRVPISQGMAAFNAAQMLNVPSRFLYFPDENHWVLKPQNSVLWHRNYFDWFDKYLK